MGSKVQSTHQPFECVGSKSIFSDVKKRHRQASAEAAWHHGDGRIPGLSYVSDDACSVGLTRNAARDCH